MKGMIWKLFVFLSEKEELSFDQKKELIDSFDEPKDDYERAYYNYLCKKYKARIAVLNIMGIIGILLLMIVYIVNTILVRKSKEKYDAAIIHANNRIGSKYVFEDRVPRELYTEFGNIKTLEYSSFPKFGEGILSGNALAYWFKFAIRHPLSGYINFRAFITVMNAQRILYVYGVKAIINYRAEKNNMSSIITGYCERNNAEYICFMHGEIMVDIGTAFVRFSRMYIWDEAYIKVFKWSRADKSRFVVYQPAIFEKKIKKVDNPEYYILYALSGTFEKKNDNDVKIMKALSELSDGQKKCKVRPHPRWSDIKQIQELAEQYHIVYEDPRSVSVADSITNAEYIAGTYSTVLTEAYHSDCKIILDDMTEPEMYDYLNKAMFILCSKPHLRLSEMISETKR